MPLNLEDDIGISDQQSNELTFTYKDKSIPISQVEDTIHQIESDRGKNAVPRYEPKYHERIKKKYKSGEWQPTPAERKYINKVGIDRALKDFSTSQGDFQIMPETAYRYTSFAGTPEDLKKKDVSSKIMRELLQRSHKRHGGDLQKSLFDWNQGGHYFPRFKKFMKEKGIDLGMLNPFHVQEAFAEEMPGSSPRGDRFSKLELQDDIGILDLQDDIGLFESAGGRFQPEQSGEMKPAGQRPAPQSMLEAQTRYKKTLRNLDQKLDSGLINAQAYADQRQQANLQRDEDMKIIDQKIDRMLDKTKDVPDLEDRITRDIISNLSPRLGAMVSSFFEQSKGKVLKLLTGKEYLSEEDKQAMAEMPVSSTAAGIAGGVIPYALAASTGVGLPVAFGGVSAVSELADVSADKDKKDLSPLQKAGRVGVAGAGGAITGKIFKDARLLDTVVKRVATGASGAGAASSTESLINNAISGEDLDVKGALMNGLISFSTIFALGAFVEIPRMRGIILREASNLKGKEVKDIKEAKRILNDAKIPEHKLSPEWQQANEEVKIKAAITDYRKKFGISEKDARYLMGRSSVKQKSELLERQIKRLVDLADRVKKNQPKLSDHYREQGSLLAKYKKMIVEDGVDPREVFMVNEVVKNLKSKTQAVETIKPKQEKIEIPDFKNTEEAIRFGQQNKNKPEVLEALKKKRADMQAEAKRIEDTDMSKSFELVQKAQFPREALEAAEGKLENLEFGKKEGEQLNPDPVDLSKEADRPPAGWDYDTGAVPGEPMWIHKASKGAVTEKEIEGKGGVYVAIDAQDNVIGQYNDFRKAVAAVERAGGSKRVKQKRGKQKSLKKKQEEVVTPEAEAVIQEVIKGIDPEKTVDLSDNIDRYAKQYAESLGHKEVTDFHKNFVKAIINKDQNGILKLIGQSANRNKKSQKIFEEITGIKLPSTGQAINKTVKAYVRGEKIEYKNLKLRKKTGEIVLVKNARKVVIEGKPLYVHKYIGDKTKYTVSDAVSGLSISNGRSEEEAIQEASKILKVKGEEFDQLVKKAVDKYGVIKGQEPTVLPSKSKVGISSPDTGLSPDEVTSATAEGEPLSSKETRYVEPSQEYNSLDFSDIISSSHPKISIIRDEMQKNFKNFKNHLEKAVSLKADVRVKDAESLAGKIQRFKMAGKNPSLISDNLAGRVVTKKEDINAQIKNIEDNFDVVEIDNFFDTPTAFGYRGVNIKVRLPNGIPAEVQIHTEKSMEAAGVIHKIYERWRNKDVLKFTDEQKREMAHDIEVSREIAAAEESLPDLAKKLRTQQIEFVRTDQMDKAREVRLRVEKIEALLPKKEPPLSPKKAEKEKKAGIVESAGNKKRAANLRKKADNLQNQIDAKLNPAIGTQNPTARRARIAAGIRADGEFLQTVQQILRSMADETDAGTLPSELKGIDSKEAVIRFLRVQNIPKPEVRNFAFEDIVKALKGVRGAPQLRDKLGYVRKVGYYNELNDRQIPVFRQMIQMAKGKAASHYIADASSSLREYERMQKAGIKTQEQYDKVRKMLQDRAEGLSEEQKRAKEIKAAEDQFIGTKMPGFFPTPQEAGQKVVDLADIGKGDEVLEPSAGTGSLADLAKEAGGKVDVVEISPGLTNLLKLKGHNVIGSDFMEIDPAKSKKYDRIVMNPPFEKLQDIDHVMHAYKFLKPGGTLVSIMSEGPFFRGDKKAQDFRDFVKSIYGYTEKLPGKSFQKSLNSTGVSSRVVVLNKEEGKSVRDVEKKIGESAVDDVDFMYAGLPPLPPNMRKQVNDEIKQDVSFTDPEIEARYKASKGVPNKDSLIARIKELFKETERRATRVYPTLPNEPRYAELRNILSKQKNVKSISQDRAIRAIDAITASFGPKKLDLFTRKIILDDLLEEAAAKRDLPYGYSEMTPEGVIHKIEALKADSDKINAIVEANADIKEALNKRAELWAAITSDLVDYGILKKEQVKENYFRHQVLNYAQAKATFGTGQKLKEPSPGYAKRRRGSLYDINSDYTEAEFEVMAQALHDIETIKHIKEIENSPLNIKTRLVDEAMEQQQETGKAVKWRDIIPKGYTTWQPKEGNIFFTAYSLPQRIVNEVLDGYEVGVKDEDLRKVLALGGKRRELVLPDDVVKTLNELYQYKNPNFIMAGARRITTMWKKWILMNPRRFFKYNYQNFLGDFDAVVAGDPRILKRFHQANAELADVFYKGKPMTNSLREFVERGGISTQMTVQELPELRKLEIFQRLSDRPGQDFKRKMNLWEKYWQSVGTLTTYRESILRYASYLHYREMFTEGVKKKNYGASVRQEVDALKDPIDKAAKVATELLGDYSNITALGQDMREAVIPFYSWYEINMKRYYRMMRNNFDEGWEKGLASGAALAGIKGSAFLLKWFLRAIALSAGMLIYNHLFHRDVEDTLSEYDRNRLHIALGKTKDGESIILRGQSAFGDLLEWFGLDGAPTLWREYFDNKASLTDIFGRIPFTDFPAFGLNPMEGKIGMHPAALKMVRGVNPLYKLPFETLTGKSLPVFDDRAWTVQDKTRNILRAVSLENEYDKLMQNPTRGYYRSLMEAVVTIQDPQENAYRYIQGEKYKFLETVKGRGGSGDYYSPRSTLYRKYKKALRFKDKKAQERILAEMKKMGITQADMNKSLNTAHPLHGLSKADRAEFENHYLTKRDREIYLKRAKEYYRETFLRTALTRKEIEKKVNAARQAK